MFDFLNYNMYDVRKRKTGKQQVKQEGEVYEEKKICRQVFIVDIIHGISDRVSAINECKG